MEHIIKTIIEKILYIIYAKKYKELYKLVDAYDYISFDIFDTLIKRNINDPTDIFLLIEEKYNIKNFKENRIKAEKEARKKSNYEDVTLEEIYKELNNYSESKKEELIKLEIKAEKDLCVLNKPMYEFYKYCLFSGKKIFLTSDMYLDINTIKEILNNSGYKDYENIYLSSKYRLRKRTGNLFKKLLKDEKISKDKIIHIGDSITGDFLVPRKLGLNTILIKRKINNSMFKSKKNKSLKYNILSSFINNNVYDMNTFERLGYEVLGPILYGFTSWIHEQVKKDKIDKLYFLARDAKIIMEVYKKRYNEDIPIHYLKVSRISVLNATVDDINSLDDVLHKYKSIIKNTSKVENLINILNIEKKVPYKNKLIMDLSNKEKNEIFNIIKDDIETNSKIQNDNLKLYLQKNDFTGNVGIVDIGWNGTIQYILNNIVDSKTKLYGYYFGVNKDNKYKEHTNLIRNGYLFNSTNYNDYQSMIYLNIGLFEMMFLSTDGSTIKYKKENNHVKVIQGKIEYSKANLISIESLQNSALQFIEDIEIYNLNKYLNSFNKEIYFENFKNITINPTLKNIKIFKNVEFQNFNTTNLINNKNYFYYVFHIKNFYKDFMNSYCKVYFMKNVFKINLPYYKILMKIYYKKKIGGKNYNG